MVNQILHEKSRPDRDLRIAGLVVIFAAPGLAVLAWFVGKISIEGFHALLGVSALAAFIGVGLLVMVGVGWFFTPAVIDTVDMLSQVLPQPVFEWTGQESFISRLLAPMNAIAVPVAILFLLARKIYRLFFQGTCFSRRN